MTCSIEGCESKAHARGWCTKHYYRWKRQGSAEYVRPARTCEVGDCGRPHEARGMCFVHHQRWLKHGDPMQGARVVRTPTCDVPGCDKPSPSVRYCSMHYERLKRNGNFERQDRTRHLHSMGYVKVKREGHPLAQQSGWVYEHRLVLLDKIGPGEHPCHWCGTTVSWDRSYPQDADGLVVDHLDEDRGNNDPENLVPSCSVCNFQRSDPLGKRWGNVSA